MSLSAIGANAYSFVQKATDSGGAASGTLGTSGAIGGFGDLLSSAISDTTSTLKNSENISASAITGKASLSDVVSAVTSADVALKSVVAIRDKVIGAYQDIMKMPI